MKERTLAAVIDNIPEVTAFIEEQLEALDCPMKAQLQIDVAVDELFTNIAHYAYPDKTGSATVQFDDDEGAHTVSITCIDSGIPFDPLKKADPDVTLAAEEREVGGLGIFMVKKSMDNVTYRFENGHNILTIQKRIG
ncbi:MAG: ATP-binding protein [Clostridia bacterium]|nr:ATP-binding protein [Clostridia bacterium]